MISTDLMHQHPYDTWRWAEELFSRRDYLGAARALEELLEDSAADDAYRPQVTELLARSYYHSARLGPAEKTARAILEADPTNGYMALLLSRTLERANDPEGAASYRQRANALGVEA